MVLLIGDDFKISFVLCGIEVLRLKCTYVQCLSCKDSSKVSPVFIRQQASDFLTSNYKLAAILSPSVCFILNIETSECLWPIQRKMEEDGGPWPPGAVESLTFWLFNLHY